MEAYWNLIGLNLRTIRADAGEQPVTYGSWGHVYVLGAMATKLWAIDRGYKKILLMITAAAVSVACSTFVSRSCCSTNRGSSDILGSDVDAKQSER